ncbi:efflux RND transporter periplasmic adaptor subunit [Variovorax dokdonensis]|uniref:Efflux RND transporter periplasmic adaptor subunit n=1 Tax=Variovorax dokdonensis TaxID=344883 RepID=A0ABT7N8D4_9BURK|nr:efflux RND transporter periplasmic adaptor subunit [Variovorax dokdonensis]MDM0044206.1 efflux RND transporter periplasmic adaptor subunit [Variovorax dokdonensis]
MSHRLWRKGPVIAAAFVAVGLTGCKQAEAPPEPVRAVKVVEVGADRFDTALEFSGEVRAQVESRLGFRVAGKITERQAQLGQHVAAGTVLAQLDPRDYQLAADAARAQAVAAATSRDLASADLKRYRELRAQNFISAAELERRESTYRSAQAQLEQAQAQVASQGNQARYTRLVADASGVITSIDAEPGQVVSAGTPVVRLAHDGARDVVFSVPEDQVDAVPLGSPVMVRRWAEQGDTVIKGSVREVAASADAVTRTYTVKVAIDADKAPPLGATVYARPQSLSHVGAPVIKLPTSALRQAAQGKGSAVWVLDKSNMTVQLQPVQVATADGNEAVIASGLTPGMLVVSAGVHVLSPGQKVSLYKDKYARPAEPAAAIATVPVNR